MIRLALGLVLLTATAAAAEEIDCARLLASQAPYALTATNEVTQPDHPATHGTVVVQMFRKGGETLAYFVNSPSNFTRNRYAGPLFLIDTFSSLGRTHRSVTYSIDTAPDYVARAAPVEFDMTMKAEDGHLLAELHATVTFAGTVGFDLGPCHLELVKIRRKNAGTMEGKPSSFELEFWYSPELRAVLYSRLVYDTGVEQVFRATGITTAFTPME